MLTDSDRERIKTELGADDSQVERDHLISHVLAELSGEIQGRLKFYGGTALLHSYLPNRRLSDDVDLIAVGPRAEIAQQVTRVLTRGLAREYSTSPDRSLPGVAVPPHYVAKPILRLRTRPVVHPHS